MTPATVGDMVTFDKPQSWQPGEVRGLRKAAFVVSEGDEKAEVTVIDLSASAALWLPNVNIWRQQIQLARCSEGELVKITSSMDVGDVEGQFVELVGPEEAILGVMAVRGSRSWFVKMKGDAQLVQAETERFQQFVKSIEFRAAGDRPRQPGRSVSGATTGSSPIDFNTPEGWVAGRAGGMRKAAFLVNDQEQSVEVTVIDLAASAGELLPNINRWREQIALEPITEQELTRLVQPVPFAGVEGQYVEMLGPEGTEPRQAIFGTIAVRGPKAWFVKMIGDADLALREKERFQQFVASIRFVDAAPGGAEPPAQNNTFDRDPPSDLQPGNSADNPSRQKDEDSEMQPQGADDGK
jgi:hypothetical protein